MIARPTPWPRRIWPAALLVFSVSLAGCTPVLPDFLKSGPSTDATVDKEDAVTRAGIGGEPGKEEDKPTFTQFTDIPIPSNSALDMDQLLVLGTEDGWMGRLALTTSHPMAEMYSFYEREMPKFGWNKISVVRAAISTMTYIRGGRIATITLQRRTAGGAAVDFTVAPSAVAPSAGVPGAAVAPRPQIGSRS